jgi:hypothetical protein
LLHLALVEVMQLECLLQSEDVLGACSCLAARPR